jgi:hypothetical protein
MIAVFAQRHQIGQSACPSHNGAKDARRTTSDVAVNVALPVMSYYGNDLSELSEKPLDVMDRTDVVNQTRVVDRFIVSIVFLSKVILLVHRKSL